MQTAPYPRVGLIVTNMTRPAERVIRFYNQRGTAEPWIKEGKKAVTCPARAKTTDRTLTQAEATPTCQRKLTGVFESDFPLMTPTTSLTC